MITGQLPQYNQKPTEDCRPARTHAETIKNGNLPHVGGKRSINGK